MSEVLEAFHAEFAPTVLLVVEGVFLEQLVAPFLQAAFAPVLFPKLGTGIAGGGAASGFVNLVEAFPARRGKGCGKEGKAVFGGIAGGFGEAQGKALQAARTAFGLVFQPQHLVAPGIVVVVGVNKVQPLGGDKADGLVLAHECSSTVVSWWGGVSGSMAVILFEGVGRISTGFQNHSLKAGTRALLLGGACGMASRGKVTIFYRYF